jgi:hypothetical protein
MNEATLVALPIVIFGWAVLSERFAAPTTHSGGFAVRYVNRTDSLDRLAIPRHRADVPSSGRLR